jgi:hypothetical protein
MNWGIPRFVPTTIPAWVSLRFLVMQIKRGNTRKHQILMKINILDAGKSITKAREQGFHIVGA